MCVRAERYGQLVTQPTWTSSCAHHVAAAATLDWGWKLLDPELLNSWSQIWGYINRTVFDRHQLEFARMRSRSISCNCTRHVIYSCDSTKWSTLCWLNRCSHHRTCGVNR